jgi:hypothetical protein
MVAVMDEQQHQPQPEPSEDSAPGYPNSLPRAEAGYDGRSEGLNEQAHPTAEETPRHLNGTASEQPDPDALELTEAAPEQAGEEPPDIADSPPEQPEVAALELTQPAPEQTLIEVTSTGSEETEEEEPQESSTQGEGREEQDRREEGRVPVYFETEVRCLGEPYRATIRDLSRWGALAECEEELKVRSYIYVVLPGVGSLPARVTWAKDGRFGANLLEPITDEHFERLVRVLPRAPIDQAA